MATSRIFEEQWPRSTRIEILFSKVKLVKSKRRATLECKEMQCQVLGAIWAGM
jgi:hypothetical protein